VPKCDVEIEELVDLIWFCLTCERGKIALGEGNGSVGDLVPGYFTDDGLVDVEAFLSDKARPTHLRSSKHSKPNSSKRRGAAPGAGRARRRDASLRQVAEATRSSVPSGSGG
jgi:hypothetical protein